MEKFHTLGGIGASPTLCLTVSGMPLQPTLTSQGKGLCLLSLDAGGTRSISQLKILVEMMHQLNFDTAEDKILRPCDVFDMIGGTGSGGFVAILLVTFGLTAEKSLEEFIELSVNILELREIDAQARTAALKIYIENLLQKYELEKERRLLDSIDPSKRCKLVVPISYKHHVGPTCALRNFNVPKEQALNFTIAEALHATLATPPLFTSTPIFKDSSTLEYIAADISLSNPTREVIAEAYGVFGEAEHVACLLSVGCGHPGIFKALEPTGWCSLLERLASDSEQKAQSIDAQMGHLGLYYRFCVSHGLETRELSTPPDNGALLTHTAVYLADVSTARKVAMCVDSLKVREGVSPLHQLAHSGGQAVPPPTLPPLTRTFVMRKEPWEFIEKAIFGENDSGDVEGPRMLAVTGMGGCGKTQIVLKFLRVHRQKFGLCLFVDGSSTSHVRADVVRHIRSLDIAHSHDSFEDCLMFLSQPSPAGQRVIVYDNADDPDLELAPLLPTGESCAIIITSRNRLLGDLCPGAHLKLDVMSTNEAVELLLYSTNRSVIVTEEIRKDVRTIAEVLGCLPIALQQARSYMTQTKCSASAYLKRLSESRDVLLAQPTKFQLDMAAVSTYAAFDTSFKKLSLVSQRFIRLLSYFHWSKFPLELITLAAKYNFCEYDCNYKARGEDLDDEKTTLEEIFFHDSRWSVIHLDRIIIELQNYSLTTSTPGFGTILIEMHPLVHRWIQSCTPGQERGKYQSASILLLALGARDEYTPSAQYLASHAIHMSTVWDRLHINNAEAFACILDKGGSFQGALQLREGVVAELRGQAESDWRSMAYSMIGLANTYLSLGRPKDAEPLFQESLRLMTETLGELHPHTITASSYLALTYSGMARLKEAEMLQEEVLKLRNEVLGQYHPHTIAASNNLALTYRELGRLKEASLLQEEVLRLWDEILGERHPDTINASNNLALTYCDLGRLKEAELLQEKVLKIRKETLGNRHPDVITASNNLANTYSGLGRLKETEMLREEVLKLRKETLGDHHPDTITASNNLANTYSDLGRLKEAEILREGVLKLRKEALGPRHPDTIAASNNLALTYRGLGRLKEAELLLQQVLKLRKETLGERHPDTITASNNLALTYRDLGRLKEAELLLQEVVKLRKETLGERHPNTITASNNLALTYRDLGRLKEAEKLQRETLSVAGEILGKEHPNTLILLLTMAEIYQALGKKEDALKALDEAEPIIAKKLGKDHRLYDWCQNIRTRVETVEVSPIHASALTLGVASGTVPATPASHNVAYPSQRSGLIKLIDGVRGRLS